MVGNGWMCEVPTLRRHFHTASLCAQHGHPIRYKDTENYWRVKVPYGQVAEGR